MYKRWEERRSCRIVDRSEIGDYSLRYFQSGGLRVLLKGISWGLSNSLDTSRRLMHTSSTFTEDEKKATASIANRCVSKTMLVNDYSFIFLIQVTIILVVMVVMWMNRVSVVHPQYPVQWFNGSVVTNRMTDLVHSHTVTKHGHKTKWISMRMKRWHTCAQSQSASCFVFTD